MKRFRDCKDYPKELKVGYRTYKIVPMAELEVEKSHFSGYLYPRDRIIKLSGEESVGEAAAILLHEVLHAIWRMQEIDDTDEEMYVSNLAHGLATIIKDNPEVFKWISKNLA